jgi:lipopolysaccharide biosynthesis regulator YciM
LLEEFPDYNPVIQMIGKSYFELWFYDLADEILKPLYEKNLTNEKLAYFLWIISIKRKYFLSSNIYLNKALTNGYEPKIDVKRKLVYNYFLLGNQDKMYSLLDDLLFETEVEVSDFSLWIYQAILDDKTDKALEYTKKASVIFPLEARFYGYLIEIYLKKWDIELAKQAAIMGKEINAKDIWVIFYEGLIFKQEQDYAKAFLSFRRVVSLDGSATEFTELAQNELREIQKLRENN